MFKPLATHPSDGERRLDSTATGASRATGTVGWRSGPEAAGHRCRPRGRSRSTRRSRAGRPAARSRACTRPGRSSSARWWCYRQLRAGSPSLHWWEHSRVRVGLAGRGFVREGWLSAAASTSHEQSFGERPGRPGLAQALRPRVGNRRFVRLVHRPVASLAVDVGGRTFRFQLGGR